MMGGKSLNRGDPGKSDTTEDEVKNLNRGYRGKTGTAGVGGKI